MNNRFILYVCPTDDLAQQLDEYFYHSQQQCGKNPAHQYMPHCTLTGFFQDSQASVPLYTATIESVLATANTTKPDPVATVTQLLFLPHWHGLIITSPWLKTLTQAFAAQAISPTRQEALRLKDWLHISLAYEFDPAQAARLQQLAEALVDPSAAVGWELRLYQRSPQNEWTDHGVWRL
ncbi:MAG: hypothetical protein VKJ64_03320 [Leptolyngbyaceae bacterium]|nr:hypothetical protein [Leptolyngbyaceae bacterium]